jgi:hypothetical protein
MRFPFASASFSSRQTKNSRYINKKAFPRNAFSPQGAAMEQRISRTKKAAFWLIALVLVLGFIEICAFAACRKLIPSRIANRAEFKSAKDYVAAYRKAMLKRANRAGPSQAVGQTRDAGEGATRTRMFHQRLGWDYPRNMQYRDDQGVRYAHGPLGERSACRGFPTAAAAVYGDSFTYCSDVEDCATWETFLAEFIGAAVLNFGVAGYGTDQALLKYEINEAGVSAPVVMLGILPDDINRVVSVFRTFYAPEDMVGLTKPRFVVGAQGFELKENPLARPQDASKLEDPAFVEELGRSDYWYQEDMNRPRFGFPYILTLTRWRKVILDHFLFGLAAVGQDRGRPVYPGNLFDQPEPLAIMRHITDRFVQTAVGRGATPVIVIMAHKELVQETMKFGRSRAEPLLVHLKSRGYNYIDLIGDIAAMRASKADLANWFHEHATAEGNRVIAKIIADYLCRRGLAQCGSAEPPGLQGRTNK